MGDGRASMDRKQAEQTVALLNSACDSVCDASELLRDQLPPEVFAKFAEGVGKVAAIIALDLVPIVGREHPDLDVNVPRDRRE